ARQSYERGMRALYTGDRAGAMRNFSAALEIDPRFFAAAYSAIGATGLAGLGDTLRRRAAHAVAASDSAPERERLQIRTLWAILGNDPRAVPYAESLASRYPAEPEGAYFLGHALVHAGDFTSAIALLKPAIASDSTMFATAAASEAPCRVCVAMSLVAQTYIYMDSMAAASRWVDAWRAASGGNGTYMLGFKAVVSDLLGRRGEALALVRDS